MLDTAIILAIGSKAHHSKLTYNRPRIMLPALGKPMVVRAMDRLYRVGIRKFIVVLGEQEGEIASYLTERWLPDVTVEFALKLRATPLGQTLTDITRAHGDPILITGYNSFTHGQFPSRLIKFHNATPSDLIVTGAANSLSNASQHHFGHVQSQTEETGHNTESRPPAELIRRIATTSENDSRALVLIDFAVAGRGFVEFLEQHADKVRRASRLVEIARAYLEHAGAVRLARASWVLQVETDTDLLTLNRHLLEENIDANILSELPYTVRIREPVRIDPGVTIGQGAVIGPYTYLERGSSVGHDAHVRGAVVLDRAVVGAGMSVENMIVSARGNITT